MLTFLSKFVCLFWKCYCLIVIQLPCVHDKVIILSWKRYHVGMIALSWFKATVIILGYYQSCVLVIERGIFFGRSLIDHSAKLILSTLFIQWYERQEDNLSNSMHLTKIYKDRSNLSPRINCGFHKKRSKL
jgi:hypothetical protein